MLECPYPGPGFTLKLPIGWIFNGQPVSNRYRFRCHVSLLARLIFTPLPNISTIYLIESICQLRF
ncbi:hypothetical protein AB205_0197720 [Aquarana catesbeiana]|uniref:Uncharacterized protein n=1 Tax=Aquarana catesbeiana TaxID=8400 RepID=A0A2G9S2U6_AQUCT|nr:hypothetical protein AB205_0197720 [Aquarana catesbeiana]